MKKVIFILIMLTMTAGLFAQDMPAAKSQNVQTLDKCSITVRGIWDPMPGWIVHDFIINIWEKMPAWKVHW